jgi:hypothetical protein
MPNIVHRIGSSKASLPAAYRAVATRDGLAQWWTTKVTGTSKVGEVLKFHFGRGGPEFEVLELSPSKRVRWRCVAGPDEWIGTEVQFRITRDEGDTAIFFRHCGWRDEDEFMHHCSTQWAYFLLGLRALLETGRGAPYGAPEFQPISSWSK